MLQRAATHAYSWWWASHIRTKQSKWLEQSLQDMEEKVQNVLKLIEEDGDSFAKRAEMYYKKRPELIHFVEESYRAFRALAERYDHLSTELQNANNTLASMFPEEVELDMDDDEESVTPKLRKNLPQVSAPNVPKAPSKDLKGLLKTATKHLKSNKSSETADTKKKSVAKSGLSKSQALEEIDRLQKDILSLQTVKEFMKSSYENKLSKYWGIENQIMELQQKVCNLQDEFKVGTVIDDNDARTLMAETALKSCQETLTQLQQIQEKSSEESRSECRRTEEAQERLKILKCKFFPDQVDEDGADDKDEIREATEMSQSSKKEVDGEAEKELDDLKQKIKENLEEASNGPLTVSVMAEKIDELVNKVINLENAVSSQTALINRLRTENDDLQAQIRSLEDDKAILTGDDTYNLHNRLHKVEEKLHGIQDLNQNVENHNNNLRTHFTEAHCSLDHLSDKLYSVKPDEEHDDEDSLEKEIILLADAKPKEESEKKNAILSSSHDNQNSNVLSTKEGKDMKKRDLPTTINNLVAEDKEAETKTEKWKHSMPQDKVAKQHVPPAEDNFPNTLPQETEAEKEGDLHWRLMLLSGFEDREKVLLTEYDLVLRSYKDVKIKLSEVEKKNQDTCFDMTVQIRDLRSAIAKRDEEIQSLSKRLKLLQDSSVENKDLEGDSLPVSGHLDDRSRKPEAGTEDLVVNEDLAKNGEDIKLVLIDQPQVVSVVEEKLRMNIDAILDENLDFWLRFSTAFHQIQEFKSGVKDLKDEIIELKKKKQEKNIETDLKSDIRPIYKHLREIEAELTLWKERSALLKDELECRFSSLCNIQDEITLALKEGVEEEEIKFTSYQATKFQGEVLNMKQENNKVREELEAGLYHVMSLQLEIEKTLTSLDEEFGFSEPKDPNRPQLTHTVSQSRVPLRSFIFGTRPKKQKPSIFSRVNPRFHRKYQALRDRQE